MSKIAIIMGSKSDLDTVKHTADILEISKLALK